MNIVDPRTENAQLRAELAYYKQREREREVAEATARIAELEAQQRAADEAAAAAAAETRAAEVESNRQAAWANHYLESAVDGGDETFARYLMTKDKLAAPAEGWPPGYTEETFEAPGIPEIEAPPADSVVMQALAKHGLKFT